MKLAVKITVLLFGCSTLFIGIVSVYFYSLMNQNFTRQAESLMKQSMTLLQQRLDSQRDHLMTETEQLASTLFTENEATLAAILANPPDFNREVVGFAEKLRRRTTLDFLYVISSDGLVLSNSLEPAAFGKRDPRSDFPLDQSDYVLDGSARMELKRKMTFGRYVLYLRGGYFLRQNLESFSPDGIHYYFTEAVPGDSSAALPRRISQLRQPL